MKRRLSELSIVLVAILIGVFSSRATGALPGMLPWLAWLPLAVSMVLVVLLERRAARDEAATSSGDSRAGDTLDAEGAQALVPRPSGPVAQSSVTTSAGGATGSDGARWQATVTVGESAGTVIGIQQVINQAKATSALHQLRAPVGDFVGREHEIEQFVQALSKAAGAAAAISGVRGLGGIGKTELAYTAAQRLAAQFPDAQLLVELAGPAHSRRRQPSRASSAPSSARPGSPMTSPSFRRSTATSSLASTCSSWPTTPGTPRRCARSCRQWAARCS